MEPSEAIAIKQILQSMGVEKYHPNVVPQLLEYYHRKQTNKPAHAYMLHIHSNPSFMHIFLLLSVYASS